MLALDEYLIKERNLQPVKDTLTKAIIDSNFTLDPHTVDEILTSHPFLNSADSVIDYYLKPFLV